MLWKQTGYFEGASDLKPLLHFWSLALEEQYYLVLPALLVFSPARLRTATAIAVTLDTTLARILSPIERVFGVTLLGANTYNQIQGRGFGFNGN